MLAHGMSPPSLSSRDSSPAWELLKEALEAGDADAVQALMQAIPEGEVPRLFAHLSSAESHEALAMLDPELAGHVRVRYYEAGHMMYIHKPSRGKMKEDVAAFYAWALADPPPAKREGAGAEGE